MPAVNAVTGQVLSTQSPVDHGHRLTSYDTSLVVSSVVDCGRRRHNVYDKKPQRYAKDNRTAHLTACSDKSVAYVTNNKRLLDVFYCWRQTWSITWPLCDSRASCSHIARYWWASLCNLSGPWLWSLQLYLYQKWLDRSINGQHCRWWLLSVGIHTYSSVGPEHINDWVDWIDGLTVCLDEVAVSVVLHPCYPEPVNVVVGRQ